MSKLFRDEAVEAQRPQTLGAVRLAAPVSHRVWGVVAAITTIVIISWLCFGSYTRRERVTGRLVPQYGLIIVRAHTMGTVSKLMAKTGTQIRAGELLVKVSTDQSSAAIGDTGDAVTQALREQQTQIRATLKTLTKRASTQEKDLRNRIAMIHKQLRQIDAQLDLQRIITQKANTLVDKVAPLLQQGYISIANMNRLRANALNGMAEVKQLVRQRLDAKQRGSQLTTQLKQLPVDTAKKKHQLRLQLAKLSASKAKNAVRNEVIFRAAANGTVTSVLVNPGQSVEVGQPLLSILPNDSPLVAQLLVPSSAIGFVHKGTSVVLHYQAFPYQKFGAQHGKVTRVSRSALTPAQVSSLLGTKPPPHPLYPVKVKLQSQTIEAYEKRQALMPGMTLNADLLLDHRTMIEWIFEPLYSIASADGATVNA